MPALTPVSNNQTSDASHLNQYRNLFRGNLFFDARNGYGVVGDLKSVTDGVMTSGSSTLSSASAAFTAADASLGKHIEVAGAGANQLSNPGAAPTTAANGTAADATMPNGAYTFAYSYTNPYGETLLSPTSTPAITTTGGSPSVAVTFTAMPAGAASVKIYVVTGPAGTVGFTGVTATSGTTVIVSQANAAAVAPSSNTASAVLSTTISAYISPTQVTLAANAGTSVGLLAVPTNATFSTATTGGTLAAGTYYYRVTAQSASGGETTASTETSQVVPAGTSTNTVTVNWGAVAGAVGYKVYGRATGTEQLIATVGITTSYLDTGLPSASGALPSANSAGAGASYGSDDTAALQAVADALPKKGGATLVLSSNSFISGTVLFSAIDNLTVLAYGSLIKLTARVDWGDSGSAYRHGLQFEDCSNLQIVGLSIDGNGAALKTLATAGQFTCLGLTSSAADIRSATVKSSNLLLADCDISNIRAIGVGLRLVNGATIQDSRFTTLWCESSASVTYGHCFAVRCDNVNFDSNYVDGSNGGAGAVGFMCGPGHSQGGVANYFLPYLNYTQNLNYLQLASFIAPAATANTSTITVGYGQVTAPGPAPTLGDGGVAGTLTAGTYTVGYTYVNAFGETTISSTATTASLTAGHQISIGAISSIPNYVQFLKFYITATSGTSALGFALQVPVTANATSATNITAPGNTVTAPVSNGTAAAEIDLYPEYIKNDWYFVCSSAGSGTNAGIVAGDAIKVTSVDQVNKTIIFQRMDGADATATVPLNWAGQKVYFYSIATRLFCKNIEVSHNTLRNFSSGTNTGGGLFLGGVKNFVVDGNQGDHCADVVLDCEWVCKGQISNNTVDNGPYNTCIGLLHFIQDVAVTGNSLSGGMNGILLYSNAAIASNIMIADNSVRGSGIGIQCQQNYGDTLDTVLEGLTIEGNVVRGGPRYGTVGTLGALAIQVGRNNSQTADKGGYMRDVLITGNMVENVAQVLINYNGITGLSILNNHLNTCGYRGIQDDNAKTQSLRVLIEGNTLNNLGYRTGYTGQGFWQSAIAPTDVPKIGRNHWRNVDSSLDNTQGWYWPAGVNTHPTGPDYNLIGASWLRTSGNALQVSTDTTQGADGIWKTVLSADSGTATGAALAVTQNLQSGTITTEALSTAAAGLATYTITNSRVAATSKVFVSVKNGTNTTQPVYVTNVVPAAGSFTIGIRNAGGGALNGTLKFDYLVLP